MLEKRPFITTPVWSDVDVAGNGSEPAKRRQKNLSDYQDRWSIGNTLLKPDIVGFAGPRIKSPPPEGTAGNCESSRSWWNGVACARAAGQLENNQD